MKIISILFKSLLIFSALIVVSFLTLYIGTRGDYKVAETVAQDSTLPYIELAGVVFHSETFGNDTNPVIIVIHGGPGNDYQYLLPLKALSDSFYVVFYDQRGTGLSPRVDASELSLETTLQDLDTIISYYSPNRKVILIGHSWGAMVASGYIARYPDRVQKVVLAEPGMLTTEMALEFRKKFKVKFSWSAVKAFTITWFQSMHIKGNDKDARMDYFFGTIGNYDVKGNPMKGYFCNGSLSTAYLPYWRLGSTASQAIIEKAMDEQGNIKIDLVSGLENYPNNVLFLAGECNTVIGPDYQQGHLKYFRKAEMIVIKNAGHSMIGEKPEECIGHIRNYIREVDRAERN